MELNLHAHFRIGTLLSLDELTIQDRIVTSIDDEVQTEVTTCRHIISSPLHEQNKIRQSDSDNFSNSGMFKIAFKIIYETNNNDFSQLSDRFVGFIGRDS